jgi:hypothetical protein
MNAKRRDAPKAANGDFEKLGLISSGESQSVGTLAGNEKAGPLSSHAPTLLRTDSCCATSKRLGMHWTLIAGMKNPRAAGRSRLLLFMNRNNFWA